MGWRSEGEGGWFVCLRRERKSYRLWEMNNLMSPLQSLLDDDIRGVDLLIATGYPNKVLLMRCYYCGVLFDAQRSLRQDENGP